MSSALLSCVGPERPDAKATRAPASPLLRAHSRRYRSVVERVHEHAVREHGRGNGCRCSSGAEPQRKMSVCEQGVCAGVRGGDGAGDRCCGARSEVDELSQLTRDSASAARPARRAAVRSDDRCGWRARAQHRGADPARRSASASPLARIRTALEPVAGAQLGARQCVDDPGAHALGHTDLQRSSRRRRDRTRTRASRARSHRRGARSRRGAGVPSRRDQHARPCHRH